MPKEIHAIVYDESGSPVPSEGVDIEDGMVVIESVEPDPE